MNKIEIIKRFYFPYPSSKFFSIAGAMQKNFSSSKKTKIHFLSSNFIHVRDRTACLNSFCVVAYMQHKRVSSDSPTITALKSSVVGVVRTKLLFYVVMETPKLHIYKNQASLTLLKNDSHVQ